VGWSPWRARPAAWGAAGGLVWLYGFPALDKRTLSA